jgi:pyrroline-5-carboxylate reductase
MRIDGTIAIIGAGNMAEAMIKGLIAAGAVAPEQLVVSEPRADRRKEIGARYGVVVHGDNREAAAGADILLLAVKPQILDKVLGEIEPRMHKDALVITIAAGVPTAMVEAKLGDRRVVRAMPNTPALIGLGATVVCAGEHATEDDLEAAKRIFDSVGMTVVLDETLLDAATGLSGSGPAYVFLIIEALSDAGVKVGLSRYNAQELAAQTLLGAAKLLIDTGEHPGRLKDMVTSPGGTAIAGLHTLEAGGLRTTLINAVEAATNRSRELGAAMLAQNGGPKK